MAVNPSLLTETSSAKFGLDTVEVESGDSQSGRGAVDVRARGRGRADEQRAGTRAAPCRDLATGQWRDRQCPWQPVCGADADGGRHLPTAEAQCAGLSQRVLRGAPSRTEGPVPAAGEVTSYRDRQISPTPPRERVPPEPRRSVV